MKEMPLAASPHRLRTGLLGSLFGIFTVGLLSNISNAENKAFVYATCNYQTNDSIIRIPPHITSIPEEAFAGMSNIKRIEIPENSQLHTIGAYTFWQCSALEEISLPADITTLGECCFQECSSLERIALPEKITSLPRYCFAWCNNLKYIKLPAELTSIHRHAFAYCSSLTDITLPSNLNHIGLCVFSFCESLSEITIPDSVTQIESYAFSECNSLQKVHLPDNDSLLGELIFSGCRNLQYIYEPSATPPEFDCNSFLFEPDESELYSRCQLIVPTQSVSSYRQAHAWNKFRNITSR